MIDYLDPLGAIFALIATYFLIKANILAWPVSLIAICIHIVLYYQVGLYGDVGLAMFYFISSLYGWYVWSVNHKSTHLNQVQALIITDITRIHMLVLTITGLIGTSIVYYLLSHYSDSDVALFDAITTVLSLIA